MTDSIKSIIGSALKKSGFTAFEDFENVDTLDYPEDYLGFIAVKELTSSRWVRSLDCKTYATELSGKLCVRLMGKRGIFDDHLELDKKISNFVVKIGFSPQIIATSVKRDIITENAVLGRLEGQVYVDFNVLVTLSSLWEGA